MSSPECPFCNIANTNPPVNLKGLEPIESNSFEPAKNTAHLILSTDHVLAFLDIMPLTRGHVLVISRKHYEMLGDMGVEAGQEIGKWLPVLSRVMTKTVFGDDSDRHWNVLQNNGARAAQVVPHVHFHLIPRPKTDDAHKSSFVMFGRGQRQDLDDDEAEVLVRAMRVELVKEISRIKRDEGVDLMSDLKRGKL
ncbi:hypothetical protein N7495_003878 [Penicillium taxi]|uniref:uncharacterized protein n=1 Tax=Penicillium taxi TaxID=168475 RepID=UPI002545258E|nr:uncharacterized protein N7495_003878 [Penicillium taxi]KAJ5899134.1 hypothetical protein N7495_003878 [Penicillium taxi]